MTGVYLDTGFFVALVFDDDDNHDRALDLLTELVKGNYGRPLQVSTPVLIEMAAIIHRKSRGKNKALQALKRVQWVLALIETYKIDVYYMSEEWLQQAKQLYASRQGNLDFVDAINVAYLRLNNIKTIVSFDGDYDQFASEGIARIC